MKMKTCSTQAPPVEAVRCVWCGKTYLLCKAHAAMFTGCAKDCRANIVRLLNRLWKTKLGSEEEAQILGRLRNPPPALRLPDARLHADGSRARPSGPAPHRMRHGPSP